MQPGRRDKSQQQMFGEKIYKKVPNYFFLYSFWYFLRGRKSWNIHASKNTIFACINNI